MVRKIGFAPSVHFNPRPPRGGGRQAQHGQYHDQHGFQSTPPARGAAPLLSLLLEVYIFQSTPPARGATIRHKRHIVSIRISIHAPREGGDQNICLNCHATACYFNPRPPRGGATSSASSPYSAQNISIHAPREGGDPDTRLTGQGPDISIHAPREGGDATVWETEHWYLLFQSTPPARGAT